jgi:hypothetical protein
MQHRYPPRMPLLSVRWPGTSDQPSLFALALLHDTIRDETGSSNLWGLIAMSITASDGRLRRRAYFQVERPVNPVVTHLRCGRRV